VAKATNLSLAFRGPEGPRFHPSASPELRNVDDSRGHEILGSHSDTLLLFGLSAVFASQFQPPAGSVGRKRREARPGGSVGLQALEKASDE
jgi:hypothetical protein